jgi:hypothetical protein
MVEGLLEGCYLDGKEIRGMERDGKVSDGGWRRGHSYAPWSVISQL